MGSIADWAAVFVASAAVVVAVISLLVSRATTNRTLEHSHQLAMIDAKRRAYTEALAHWSGFVAPKKGIAVLQGLERGTVVNSGLS
ncbi:MAG: hypothetical protein Q4F65_05705, partial [Propionibacteriaceae bacterium]|nr:hypothetical protein [Propionibacteriaceae bacterium]